MVSSDNVDQLDSVVEMTKAALSVTGQESLSRSVKVATKLTVVV